MHTIEICEPNQHSKNESFLDGEIEVISRSGLHITEKLIIEHLGQIKNPKSILILENRSGVSALICTLLFPEAQIIVHHIDIFYINRLNTFIEHNEIKNIKTICNHNLDTENSKFDLVLFQVTQSISAETVSHFLQESHLSMNSNAICLIAAEKKNRGTSSQLKKVYPNFTEKKSKLGSLYIAKKKDELKKIKNYEAQFEIHLQGGFKVPLTSVPGVFSHRRVDGGAQALCEVLEVKDGDKIIDMGCGCGVVGITAALKAKETDLTLLDSNSAALYSSQKNCENNNIKQVKYILSDKGITDQNNQFDLYLGNPPYFSDNKISELFIETAANVLKIGGIAYFVAKKMEDNEAFARKNFKKLEVFKRRDYLILRCIK